ncbi:MAG: type II and III secretion system protein, partial [Actinomycetia bacterium]|nr:type II and III secretion system protein [Actinomycetes bacterium]
VTVKALVSSGHAKVLSRPSVLVLDGRQARIQVGEKIPFTSNISATNTGTLSSTDYLTTGIVLNLRPRISEDGSQITMQVETLISSAGTSGFVAETGVLVAPPIQSREVQTLVRVANDTPFIIGGLIATSEQDAVSGIPWLSKIPGLGAAFRKKTRNETTKEVIVVITPHVIPADDTTFTYVIPKDSSIFD